MINFCDRQTLGRQAFYWQAFYWQAFYWKLTMSHVSLSGVFKAIFLSVTFAFKICAFVICAFMAQANAQTTATNTASNAFASNALGSPNAALCPAANCDCDAITLAVWRERCIATELAIKQDCANNQGVPRQYCMLHGPSAAPVAISALRPSVDATTPESLSLHKRKVSMLIWSVKDDLDNIQQQEQQQLFAKALQIHALLDRNIEQLYTTQRLAAEGERQRLGDAPAQQLWQEYRQELADISEALELYGKALWANMKNATNAQAQKAYRVLAMRIGRSHSLLSEHYAEAYAGEADAEGAARAWQRSALIATDLVNKEQQTENNTKRVNYYRHQSAARWNRASFYWMNTQNEEAIARALNEAERALTF